MPVGMDMELVAGTHLSLIQPSHGIVPGLA